MFSTYSKNYQFKIYKQKNSHYPFEISEDTPTHTPSPLVTRIPAPVKMGRPRHYGELHKVRVYLYISLSQFIEKERSQLPDSHENKINRHVNEMCFGCGFVYIGRKSSETLTLLSYSFFCPPQCQRSYF